MSIYTSSLELQSVSQKCAGQPFRTSAIGAAVACIRCFDCKRRESGGLTFNGSGRIKPQNDGIKRTVEKHGSAAVPFPLAAVDVRRHPTYRDSFPTAGESLELNPNQDADHLRLLSIFHYIVGGMVGFFSLFPLIHLSFGIAILTGAFDDPQQSAPPPAFMGWLLFLFSLAFIVIGLVLAVCIAVAGRKLNRRTGHLYCLVIAGLECVFMPFGTVLGVLTILVLMRPTVKALFDTPVDPLLRDA